MCDERLANGIEVRLSDCLSQVHILTWVPCKLEVLVCVGQLEAILLQPLVCLVDGEASVPLRSTVM